MLKKLLPIVLGLFTLPLYAAHIVGGDMYYECLGGNDYRVTLKIYRDCSANGPNVADFDRPAYIAIYDASGDLIQQMDVFNTPPVNIPPVLNDPCLTPPPNVCVEEGVYTFDREFPPATGGYDIVYVRCCRNGTISNLIDPGAVGATYITSIPDPGLATCNNSPEFNEFPPIVICANEPLAFDHSATDPDGDQLVYELCTPFDGGSQNDPQPLPSPTLGTLAGMPWSGGFSVNNQLAANPTMTIDAQTGLLTGTPTSQGQYVVGICVKEYRNGVLIGETRRDFQFNVTACLIDVQAIIPVVDTAGAAATGTAGVFQRQCNSFDVDFVNESINGSFYSWDFGDPSTNADTSNAFEPSYTYPDTGLYIVTLKVNEGFNCEAETRVIVRVYPTFDTQFDKNEVCLGEPIIFTDRSISTFNDVDAWDWDFGDGSIGSTQQNEQYVYGQPGTYFVKLVSSSAKGCIDSITQPVVIHDIPDADFEYTPVCINTPVDFTDRTTVQLESIAIWEWSIAGNVFSALQNPTETFPNLGTFDIQLITTSDFGCIDTIVQTVTVNPLPTITTSGDMVLCEGDIGQLWATGGEQYSWTPTVGVDDPTAATTDFEAITSTTFTVEVTDPNQCSDTESLFVDVKPLPPTNAGPDDFVCIGDSYQLQGTGGIDFLWSPAGLVSDPTSSFPTTTPTDTTTYVLQTTSIDGCINTDSVTINVQFAISKTITDDQEICEHDTIQLQATGGLYYEWSPTNTLSNSTIPDPFVFPSTTTNYQVVISNDCFTDTGLVEVFVNPLPVANAGIDDSIFRDEITYLDGFGALDIEWSPPDGLEDVNDPVTAASPFNTTDYILTVTDENGCKDTDTVRIIVTPLNVLLVPSAFTPNADGKNDRFSIIKYLNIEMLYEFKIFNRWGQIVFDADDLDDGWDGTYKDREQEMGAYVYVIRALNRDGEEITRSGTVTLIR